MHNIKHHLSEQLLMGYAAGTLPEAFNLVVATHISMCDECRAALAAYEALGGEVMVDVDPIDLAEDALAATMAMIESGSIIDTKPKSYKADPILPAPLHDYVKGGIEDVKWRKIGGGVSQMILPTSKDASARLLHIPAGAAIPDHGHHGTELTLVLQGAFVDEEDRFAAGDIEVANEDMNHTPIAEAGMDCICLAATDAPLKFNGFLPRIAQRFARI